MSEPEQTPENSIFNNPFTDALPDFGEDIINKTRTREKHPKNKRFTPKSGFGTTGISRRVNGGKRKTQRRNKNNKKTRKQKSKSKGKAKKSRKTKA